MRRAYFDHMELTPALRGLSGVRTRFGAPLIALGSVAVAVLLIACANLGNLLLVRGAARERELAIRLATGAGAGRLLRQLLTETLVLFAVGAVASVGVATLTIRALTGYVATGRNPVLLDVRYDWRLVVFAAAVALVAGLVTGVWPALRAVRTAPQVAMKDGDGRVAGSARLGASSRLLGIGQVALSLVLVVMAVAFVRTIVNLRGVDLGFSGTGVLTMSLDPRLPSGATAEAREQFWMQVLARVRAMPGVQTASLSVLTPLSGRDVGKVIDIRGFEPRSERDRLIHVNHVSENYFEAFGIQVIGGRGPAAEDRAGAPHIVVVNQAAAKAFFGGRTPIGEEISFGEAGAYRVVGVVRDHKHQSVREEAPRFAYVPLWQPIEGISRITLSVSSTHQAGQLARATAEQVHAVAPTALVSDVLSVQDQIDATLVTERLLSTLAAGFAALALVVAAIGVYGVLSYAVMRRTTEFGVKLALGARPADIAGSVFRGVFSQVLLGIAVGLPFALAGVRAAEGLLFGVTSSEPWSYLLGAAVLSTVAGFAAWIPARRAASIDPCRALRQQ
jgi:predicted permease